MYISAHIVGGRWYIESRHSPKDIHMFRLTSALRDVFKLVGAPNIMESCLSLSLSLALHI